MAQRDEVGEGAVQWRKTLESALTTARRRNIEARNLIRVLQQYAGEDQLRERIQRWLDADPAPDDLAERAVLDALHDVTEPTLRFWLATRHVDGFDAATEFIIAALALRGLKPTKGAPDV